MEPIIITTDTTTEEVKHLEGKGIEYTLTFTNGRKPIETADYVQVIRDMPVLGIRHRQFGPKFNLTHRSPINRRKIPQSGWLGVEPHYTITITRVWG